MVHSIHAAFLSHFVLDTLLDDLTTIHVNNVLSQVKHGYVFNNNLTYDLKVINPTNPR